MRHAGFLSMTGHPDPEIINHRTTYGTGFKMITTVLVAIELRVTDVGCLSSKPMTLSSRRYPELSWPRYNLQ